MCLFKIRPDPKGDFSVNVREVGSGAPPPPPPSSYYGRTSQQQLLGRQSSVRSAYTIPPPEVVQVEYRSPRSSRQSVRLPPIVHQPLPRPSYQSIPAPEPYLRVPSPQPSTRMSSRDGYSPAPEASTRRQHAVRESRHSLSSHTSSPPPPQRHRSVRSNQETERRTERRSNDHVSMVVHDGHESSRGRSSHRPRSEEPQRRRARSSARRPAIEAPPRRSNSQSYPWLSEGRRRRSYR